MEVLLGLPGVGRKTANCVLAHAFLKDALAVDTHVHRISNRLGLVGTKAPEETESELKKIFPQKYWKHINLLLVKLGQNVCRYLRLLGNRSFYDFFFVKREYLYSSFNQCHPVEIFFLKKRGILSINIKKSYSQPLKTLFSIVR